MRKVITISFWIILIAGIVVLLGFMGSSHKNINCKHVEIKIEYPGTDSLITQKELSEMIINTYDTLQGKTISSIDQGYVEELISCNPYIAKANVYSTIDGIIKIHAIQRQAILRIFNYKHQSFYIDKTGHILPISQKHPQRLLIASGCIYDSFRKMKHECPDINEKQDSLYHYPVLHKLYLLANYIHQDKFLNAMIHQIYVTKDHEFELIPKAGKHIILLGDIENMEEKFKNLIAFYKKGISKTGWEKYKKINLKYKNQVICTKT